MRFLGGAFLSSGRARGPWKASKNVGGFASHIVGVFPVPPGPAGPQNASPNIRLDCLQVPRKEPTNEKEPQP